MLTGWLRRLFGNAGEQEAARYLQGKGYEILARQLRNRAGEIDLIARHEGRIVFVEVKTRRSHIAGHPAEAVNRRKQQQLGRAALLWLKQHQLLNAPCRFDVIAITWQAASAPHIEHYLAAFEPPNDW
jgi:putative endonuclease